MTIKFMLIKTAMSQFVVAGQMDLLLMHLEMGIAVYILSTESNPVVVARGRKLSVPVIQGSSNKLISLNNLCDENGYSLKNILFSGNDLNDFEVMKLCGFSACPADSHSKIIKISNFVLSSKGGEGFVRELS